MTNSNLYGDEAAARKWSMDWTSAELTYEQLMRTHGVGDIFNALSTVESSFTTEGALAYLKHTGTTPEGLREQLEREMQAQLSNAWEEWQLGEDYHLDNLIHCIGDNWEQDPEGNWIIPPLVQKSRELLAAVGMGLDEAVTLKWNREVVKLQQLTIKLGWLIGYSPEEDPQSIALLARKVVRMYRAHKKNPARPGVSMTEAGLVLAYCNFDMRYYNALKHNRVKEIRSIFVDEDMSV